jgi:hypothetical protein
VKNTTFSVDFTFVYIFDDLKLTSFAEIYPQIINIIPLVNPIFYYKLFKNDNGTKWPKPRSVLFGDNLEIWQYAFVTYFGVLLYFLNS